MARVRADVNLCQSNGQYGLGEDILRRKGEVDPLLRQEALEAVEAHPMRAIRAED